jgi:F-type H+-transporting ATPase subunit a
MLASHGIFHHVYDFTEFELPLGFKLELPRIAGLPITKFMVLQLVAMLLTYLMFRGLTARIRGGHVASGWFWNFWEMLAVYIRDEVVRPVIGEPHNHHETDVGHGHQHPEQEACHLDSHYVLHHAKEGHPADKYLPFIWSCFFFILFCNLLGALPWLGSATGNSAVTLALAVIAFVATFLYGAEMHGYGGFWTHMVPAVDAPGPIKMLLVPMIFVIEVVGLFIKHGVLAVRLFANIMGGHTVVGVILAFIAQASHSMMWGVVAPASLGGQVAVGLLELLVAFIQAYVFAFLATIFIAMSLHEH